MFFPWNFQSQIIYTVCFFNGSSVTKRKWGSATSIHTCASSKDIEKLWKSNFTLLFSCFAKHLLSTSLKINWATFQQNSLIYKDSMTWWTWSKNFFQKNSLNIIQKLAKLIFSTSTNISCKISIFTCILRCCHMRDRQAWGVFYIIILLNISVYSRTLRIQSVFSAWSAINKINNIWNVQTNVNTTILMAKIILSIIAFYKAGQYLKQQVTANANRLSSSSDLVYTMKSNFSLFPFWFRVFFNRKWQKYNYQINLLLKNSHDEFVVTILKSNNNHCKMQASVSNTD